MTWTTPSDPGFRLPAHEFNMADAVGFEAITTIADIEGLLALFGMADTAFDGPVPDSGGALLGDPPGPESNPPPETGPVPPPGVPVVPGPGGQLELEPAPGPVNQVQPAPAEPLPLTDPVLPEAGAGSGAGSNAQGQGTGAGSNPGAGSSLMPGLGSGAGSIAKSFSGSSSSFTSSSSVSISGNGSHFGGEGTSFAAGGAVSLGLHGLFNSHGGNSSGGVARHDHIHDHPPDEEMPPIHSGPGLTPVLPPAIGPAQPDNPLTDYQNALNLRDRAGDEMDRYEESVNELGRQIASIERNIERAETAMAELEAATVRDTEQHAANMAKIAAARQSNARDLALIDECEAAGAAAWLQCENARKRICESTAALSQTLPKLAEADPALLLQHADGAIHQRNIISEQGSIIDLQTALMQGIENKILELQDSVQQNEDMIAGWTAQNRATEDQAFRRQYSIDDIHDYIVKGKNLRIEKNAELVEAQTALRHARETWDQANHTIAELQPGHDSGHEGGHASGHGGGPADDADDDGDIHMSTHSNVSLPEQQIMLIGRAEHPDAF